VTKAQKQDRSVSYGTRALKTFLLCFVLGLPLLLAFGLGVLVILYGLLAGTALALMGLVRDEEKSRSVIMLLIAAGFVTWTWYARAKPLNTHSAPVSSASSR
jgi:formate-dependent nitrite reductase membrane component NrfD